jgi:uncharacterized protein (TIGR02271 family)
MSQTVDKIQLAEEELTVAKQKVLTGSVRVRTQTETVQELANIVLDQDQVEITRIPINQTIQAAPSVRTQGDVTIVPVVEEIVVIEKRLVLKEEIHIRRSVTTETVEVPVTLRKQHAVVERQDYGNASPNQEETSND